MEKKPSKIGDRGDEVKSNSSKNIRCKYSGLSNGVAENQDNLQPFLSQFIIFAD